jgi:hypothetical protein
MRWLMHANTVWEYHMCKFWKNYDFLVKIRAKAFHNKIAQALFDNDLSEI